MEVFKKQRKGSCCWSEVEGRFLRDEAGNMDEEPEDDRPLESLPHAYICFK